MVDSSPIFFISVPDVPPIFSLPLEERPATAVLHARPATAVLHARPAAPFSTSGQILDPFPAQNVAVPVPAARHRRSPRTTRHRCSPRTTGRAVLHLRPNLRPISGPERRCSSSGDQLNHSFSTVILHLRPKLRVPATHFRLWYRSPPFLRFFSYF
jgi:hypothetical protein